MDKAADAFRTITEVAEAIGIPAHVLRFWESRFPQIKPVKRAGGRRYYRPSDVALVAGIRQLLHVDGITIREVQKVLREQGVRHVATLGGAAPAQLDRDAALALAPVSAPAAMAQVLPMTGQTRKPADPLPAAELQSLVPPEPQPLPRESAAARRPRAVAERALRDQPSLPLLLDTPPDEAPEAPHIWVEAEPAAIVDLHPRSPSCAPSAPFAATPIAATPVAATPIAATQAAPAQALADIAAQLQAMPAPAMALNRSALRDLRDRLGQLHNLMAQPPLSQR